MAEKSSSRAINEFLGEAEEILEKLNLDLGDLGDASAGGECDPEILNGIFRGAHSLKGLAGMFGFKDISDLSHTMENLLDNLRLGKISLSETLIETLFDSLETLTRLVQGKGDSEDFTIDCSSLIARIGEVLDGGGADNSGLLEKLNINPEVLGVLTEFEEHRLLENYKKGRNLFQIKTSFDLAAFDQELAEITELLKKEGEVVSTLPCPGDITDRIAFQILYGSPLSSEEVEKLLDNENISAELICQGGAEPAPEPEPKPAPQASLQGKKPEGEKTVGTSKENGAVSLRSISQTVRVDIGKLDFLMNIVGELVLSKAAIAAICDQIKAEGGGDSARELQKATRGLERRLDELQKGVMDVRMVPVAQLFDKMKRIIRKVSQETKKQVTLDIRGADTELDKLIIEDLSDPLMHIIRNSIDHGVESPEERLSIGKPEKGTICLWASQKGNHVAIEIKDDGKGIDPETVRSKALQKGLIEEDTELSREDVFNLIFSAGFSTRDEVSGLSGRGVGMDVVKNNIAALSGMVEMDSQVGKGTSITITLPITLAIIKALIIRAASKTYAIPINSVVETLLIENDSICTIERREVIELRESTLPLLRVSKVFGLPESSDVTNRSFVVVVGLGEKKMGVVVDELLGQQDVVIKSLGSTLSFVRGIAGAADLGNQRTILVLDVGGLMSDALRGESAFYV